MVGNSRYHISGSSANRATTRPAPVLRLLRGLLRVVTTLLTPSLPRATIVVESQQAGTVRQTQELPGSVSPAQRVLGR